MRCNPREVALSSALRDNSTCKLQSQMTFRLCTLFLKLGSHYFREPPAPAGWCSTYCFQKVEVKYYSPLIFCGREMLNRFFQAVEGKFEHGENLPDHLRRPGIIPFPGRHGI